MKSIIMRASQKKEHINGTEEIFIEIDQFYGLIKEVRQRMSVERKRLLKKNLTQREVLDGQLKYLKDFSMINPVKIREALHKGVEEGED